MVKSNVTARNLQKSILLLSIITTVVACLIVAAISIIPLYKDLEKNHKQDLQFTRDLAAQSIQQYVIQIKQLSKKISTQTKLNELMKTYQAGTTDLETVSKMLAQNFKKTIENYSAIAGITRYNNKGQILGESGTPLSYQMQHLAMGSNNTQIFGPYHVAGKAYLMVASPIFQSKGKRIATDAILFKAKNFKQIIQRHFGFSPVGHVFVASVNHNKIKLLSASDKKLNYIIHLPHYRLLSNAINYAVLLKKRGTIIGSINGEKMAIAYTPIQQTNWGLVLSIQLDKVFTPIQSQLLYIIAVIIAVIALLSYGTLLMLKPLTGKMILHNHDLEKVVKEKTSALEKANKLLAHMARHDQLTKLPNRLALEEFIAAYMKIAARYNHSLALLFIDIDNFKYVNDSYGHPTGDELLKKIAYALQTCLRESDFIARLGGDEFAIVLNEITKTSDVNEIAQKIIDKVGAIKQIDGHDIQIGASVGIAYYPEDGKNSTALIKSADIAMYNAKESGRNTFRAHQNDK